MTLDAGTTLGRYEIVGTLGAGGMATVYKAYQPALERTVALKVIRKGFADDPEFRERFAREAKAIARLTHANIVQVFDFDEIEGQIFLAMQHLEGGTLKDELARLAKQGLRMARGTVTEIVLDVAEALAYAHERGVIHRDVKPSNVMLGEKGRAVVTDFGIAKIMGGTQYTATGVGMGTPEYMSPEQGQGLPLDGRTDQYALGVMTYEMLTGTLPFTGDTPFAIVLKHVREPLPPPRHADPTMNEETEQVLTRALAKDPAMRYGTATEFARALSDAVGEAAPSVTLPTVVPPRPRAAAGPVAAPSELRRQGLGTLIAAALAAVLFFDLLPRAAAMDLDRLGTQIEREIASLAPSPTARPVTERPEALIMPAESLALPGFEVTRDEENGENSWRREFRGASEAAPDITRVEFMLTIDPDGGSYVLSDCAKFTWTGATPVATTMSAPSLGRSSQMCRFTFDSKARYLLYDVTDRNLKLLVFVYAEPEASDASAADLAVAQAGSQLALVERLAPP